MIDSVVYMKMRALTSLVALKIKDTVVLSRFPYKCRSACRELSVSHRKWDVRRNTTVRPALSKCSCQTRLVMPTSVQATAR